MTQPVTQPVRVVLADDHPMVRYGLRAVLASDPGTELVGEAVSGEQALELVAQLAPDVVLMDLAMPGAGGIAATREVAARHPGTAVVVLTMSDQAASVVAAVRAGARGYLVKGADREEVLRAVRAAAAGEAIFGHEAAGHLAEQLASPRPPAPSSSAAAFPMLTAREREVLGLLMAGLPNGAIAQRCRLSPKTVRNYVSTVIDKVGAESRADAVAIAERSGVRPEPP